MSAIGILATAAAMAIFLALLAIGYREGIRRAHDPKRPYGFFFGMDMLSFLGLPGYVVGHRRRFVRRW